MKLGLQLGYWGAAAAGQRRRSWSWPPRGRVRRRVRRRVVGLGRVHPAGLVGVARPRTCGSARPSCRFRADADRLRHARAHPRPPLRRAGDPRAGRVRAAGRRGLVRRSRSGSRSPAPASTSSIVRQVLAREAPVTSDGPHYPAALHRARRATGLGQAAPADHPSAACGPADLARRRGSEERRAGRRDRRRLARRSTTRRGSPTDVRRLARRGLRPPGRPAQPRETSRSRPACQVIVTDDRAAAHRRHSSRSSPSTSAEWAPRR